MRLTSLIRPPERRETAAAFITVLLVMAAHALLETARDTLFLTNIPASRLPWLYLAIAGLGVLGGPIIGRSGNQRVNRRTLVLMQLAAALGTASFLPLASGPHVTTFYLLYMWGGMAAALILVRFWLILGDRLNASQAKRLYPIIAAGAVLGSLVGYGSAGLLSVWHEPRALLLGSAVGFLASAAASALWWRVQAPIEQQEVESSEPVATDPADAASSRERGPWQSLALVVRQPYVRRIALLMLLASVAVTLCDFVFKSIVTDAIPSRRLGAFLASVYFSCDLASFALLLAAVGPLVRAVGVPQALAIRPILLLAGGILLTVVGGLPTALMLRGVDGTLRWSIHKTATELLFVPLAPWLRRAVKEVGDLVAQRGGQALGSLLILGWLALGDSERLMGPILIAAAGAWFALALSLRKPYLGLFRETLSESLVETRLDFPELDVASLETLMAALNSPDDNRVLASLDLLAATGRAHVIPALILYHPSIPVVVRALELFAVARRDDLVPLCGRLVAHGDAAVRAASMRACAWVQPDAERLSRAVASDCAIVSATALIASAAKGWTEPGAALSEVRGRLGDASAASGDTGRAVARALRDFPVAAFAPLLAELAMVEDVQTRIEAIRAMGALRDETHLPTLIDLLAYRELREAARIALLAFGDPAFEQLRRALEDFALPYSVRVHVPRTISRYGHQRATDLLLRHLLIEPGGMVRYKILRGLGRMRVDVPSLHLDPDIVSRVVDDHLAKTFPIIHWRVVVQAGAAEQPARRTAGHGLLVDLLRQKEGFAIERLFRSLGLCQPEEDFAQLYNGLRSADAETRSSSRELLDHVLPARWREAVVGLTEEIADADRLAAGGAFYEPARLDYEQLLAQLIGHPSFTVATLATYHARELGLRCAARTASAPDTQDARGPRQRWLELLVDRDDALAWRLRRAG